MTWVTRAQWGARTPKNRTTLRSSQGMAGHYNGPRMGLVNGCGNGSRCRIAVRNIQAFHMNKKPQGRDWADVAYNWLICPSCGRKYQGRGWGIRSAANGTTAGNSWGHAYMVMIGDGEPLTNAAKRAIAEVRAEHRRRYSTNGHRSHSFWRPTACAGSAIRTWIAAGAPPPGGTTPKPPKPPPQPNDSLPLSIGSTGPRVGNLQRLLNEITTYARELKLDNPGILTVTDQFNPTTARVVVFWVTRAGLTVRDPSDPQIGEISFGALQEYRNKLKTRVEKEKELELAHISEENQKYLEQMVNELKSAKAPASRLANIVRWFADTTQERPFLLGMARNLRSKVPPARTTSVGNLLDWFRNRGNGIPDPALELNSFREDEAETQDLQDPYDLSSTESEA